MTSEILFWLCMLLLSTALMSFYSTQEMAAISYSRLRLGFQVKIGKRWARWLQELTDNPTLLFSTTLIGVNAALMISSECARRFYDACGLNHNLAPLTQIPFILIFGELVPMFAARTHPEHMIRLGMPFLYLSAKIMKPLADIVDFFFRQISRLIGRKETKETQAFLSRDELQKLIEEHEAGVTPEGEEEFDAMVGNIFTFQAKAAFQLMEPLTKEALLPAHAHMKEVKELFAKIPTSHILVFHRVPQKIIGLIESFDLVNATERTRVSDHMRPACFVSENTHSLELLKRMQHESTPLAVVLDSMGTAVGVVMKDDLIAELIAKQEPIKKNQLAYLEKSLPADMLLEDFNKQYGTDIELEGCKTFHDLIEETLSRHPQTGDTIFVEPFEITVKDTSLFRAKTIQIKTK